ncbi:MAG: amidohydrolase family protein, partial [Spirochaeta sp.]|nr:amidohydrolase family protein [Spirochaeta sp.]
EEIEPWHAMNRDLGRRPHGNGTLSGMATEARIDRWSSTQLHPYIDVCLEAFGPERLMVGSDWPVCTLAGPYSTIMSVVLDYLQTLSASEQDSVFHAACREAYRLP